MISNPDAASPRRHKSIIAYLSANDLLETAATLRKELDVSEDDFDAAAVKKYETLLEKKWTSNVRLQRKASRYCRILVLSVPRCYATNL